MTLTLIDRLKLCWRILREREGAVMDHANRELPKATEPMQALMNRCIHEMLLVFSTQGHSGFSASYARQVLDKLLNFQPLGPLTGADDEWAPLGYSEDVSYQNKRCGNVFKRADGTAYDSTGRVFREPSGSCYTGPGSRVDITFPYTPTVEYVDVAS